MTELSLPFVLEAMEADLVGLPSRALHGVSIDSRSINPGELFFALKGPNFDGHDYACSAWDKGAGALVVRRGYALPAGAEAVLLKVDDPLTALGYLAHAWRLENSAQVLALTGSNGKTSTKEMLGAVLQKRHRVHKTKGNFNNLVGLPLTIMGLQPEHTAMILELGMSALDEIRDLTRIADPEVGLITNVGPAHLGAFSGIKEIAQAKTELFAEMKPWGQIAVNLDDPYLKPWAKKYGGDVITFALEAQKAAVRAADIKPVAQGQQFTLILPGGERYQVMLKAYGRHNVMNALAAAAGAAAFNCDGADIAEGLEQYTPLPGRLNLVDGPRGCQLLDDTYNANPSSLSAGLAVLASLGQSRRRALILGDMLELGPASPKLHRQAGREAVEAGCALVLSLGEMAQQVSLGAQEAGLDSGQALAFSQAAELLAAARHMLKPGDLVLIKGSRSMAMDVISRQLQTGTGED